MLKAPLVSILVINRNYGRFISATINSIRNQDYPWFQGLVVDNASTDDSRTVITRSIDDDPRFSVIHLDENLGSLGAAIHVFDHIEGDFVAVVDADDVLFTNFLSSHIQVHLAVPEAISLTSSDVVEVNAQGHVLLGSRTGFGGSCRANSDAFGLSPLAPRLSTITDEDYDKLNAAVALVPHWEVRWVWAPGTANVYRKSALSTVLPAHPDRISPDAGWDAYAIPFLHLMTGSVVIFERLSAYRLHGQNMFSRSHILSGTGSLNKVERERQIIQRTRVVDTLLAKAETLNCLFAGDRFWSTIELIGVIDGIKPCDYFAREDIQSFVIDAWPLLLSTFGARRILSELHVRLGYSALARLLGRAYGGKPPAKLQLLLAQISSTCTLQKLSRRWAN